MKTGTNNTDTRNEETTMITKIRSEDVLRNKTLADCVGLIADGVREGRLLHSEACEQLLEAHARCTRESRLVDGTHIGDVFRGYLTIAICHEDGSVTVTK